VASKDPNETYQWDKPWCCACGQYWAENVSAGQPVGWMTLDNPATRNLVSYSFASGQTDLNELARECNNFGQLLRVLDYAWDELEAA